MLAERNGSRQFSKDSLRKFVSREFATRIFFKQRGRNKAPVRQTQQELFKVNQPGGFKT